jgi:uroporphyrin-III C-methyltransferase/precorrin-2 dehydrogenase/sirohydrochlorin ferrochelatase
MNIVASRTPSEAPPPRIERLARLPVFYALEGKRTLVAGGSAGAAWKAELLAATGAEVHVFAGDASEEMRAVVSSNAHGPISLHDREWCEADLEGAAVAVGAFDDDGEAGIFAAAARRCGVPVNVVDKPKFCDFAFGSIVNRSPLVIGISTDGAAPVFGQAVRAKLEALIPAGFARWAEAAKKWRDRVKDSGLSFAGRRRFWQLFTAKAVVDPNGVPDETAFAAMLAEVEREGTRVDAGSVTLVGAGPGDAELLTLRAVRALQSADVILIDDLVSPEILDFARREAKRMLVGKAGYGPSCRQDEICSMMVSLAKAGKRVVRLKGGDPMIFGRAGEEIAACEEAGIAVEVVPGITAAQGAASRLGISLTHRDTARRLQYVTGHGKGGRLPSDLDWQAIADPAATTALYMPVHTFAEFTERAIASGLPPSTPAIAVSQATRPDERMIAGTIDEMSALLAERPTAGPVIVLIGRTLADRVQALLRGTGAGLTSTRSWLARAQSAGS